MRVVLVGRPSERARLRAELVRAGIEIVAEVDTPVEGRRLRDGADAILIAVEPAARAGEARGIDALEEPLTPREIEVLQWLAEGLPNKAIADRLGISDQTVKAHLASIFGKVGASNRTDAVRRAIRRGLITV